MEQTSNISYSEGITSVVKGSFGTHDGAFHADEVTACALLIFYRYIEKNLILRTRDKNKLQYCEFVCDVGGEYDSKKKRFDHHQLTYRGPYSSAGMILEYIRNEGRISPKEYDFLNNIFIRGIDAHDNGREVSLPGVCTFSHVIANFTPISYEASEEAQDKAFFEALEFTLGHIQRLNDRFTYAQSCQEEVQEAMKKFRDCLIFNKSLPWIDTFFELDGARHPAKFIIMPAGNFWKLRGIPPSGDERMKIRLPLPESWAGLLEHELQEKTGISGALFCHKGRFISVWKTKQDALKALRLVFEMYKMPQIDSDLA